MQGSGIGLRDLAQEHRVDVLVDGRGEEQLHRVLAIDLQGLVEVAPLVGGFVGSVE
jgi:hypothetical protein